MKDASSNSIRAKHKEWKIYLTKNIIKASVINIETIK